MKRMENFQYSYNNEKRQKLMEIDSIWGDDPEIDEVDRCIDLATQICSQSEQNKSKQNIETSFTITNYEDFKRKKNICASTQEFFQPPSSSKQKVSILSNNLNNSILSEGKVAINQEVLLLLKKVQTLEGEKKELCGNHETKIGEIAFLRVQLKQAQNAVDAEKKDKLRLVQENQQKYEEKLHIFEKESLTFKCQLELKTIDIANLKEKVSELKKLCKSSANISNLNESISSKTLSNKKIGTPNSNDNKTNLCTKNIQTKNDLVVYNQNKLYFPLKNVFPNYMFEIGQKNKSVLKLRNTVNDVTYYQHNFSTTVCVTENSEEVSNTIKYMSQTESNLNCINIMNPELLKLSKCTEEQINNCQDVTAIVSKLIEFTRINLSYFLYKLRKRSKSFLDNDTENINNSYLNSTHQNQCDCLFSTKLWSENETEIDIRRLMAVTASVCLHSNLLYQYLLGKTQNTLSINNYLKSGNNNFRAENLQEFDFLNTLLQISTNIRENHLSEQFCGFLASILKLLSKLSQKDTLSPEHYDLLVKIFRQIISAQPNQSLLKYICYFLKYLSQHKLFVERLCNRQRFNNTQSTDGLFYFTEDTCIFKILAIEIETCTFNTEMACNVISFLQNVVLWNAYWMHQEDQKCGCIAEVYSLGNRILYNSIKEYSSQLSFNISQTKIRRFYTIFQVGLLFLDYLTVRVPYIVIKCSRLYSQYQTIIKYMAVINEKICISILYEEALANLFSQLNSDDQKSCEKDDNLATSLDYYFNSTLLSNYL